MNPYAFPLLIKQLLVTPIAQRSRKEIVYRDRLRFGYPTLVERIGRLGSALTRLGVGPDSTVAVLDWDSHRYLEAYFAVPMLGATLMKTNIRLSPEQIAYTLDHSEADTVLLNVVRRIALGQQRLVLAGPVELRRHLAVVSQADEALHAR